MTIYNCISKYNIRKILDIISKPSEIPNHIKYYFQRLVIKPVIINGRIYYRYLNDLYPEYLNKGNACSFISEKALQYCKGYGLDIGAGEWVLPGAISIQNEIHENAYMLNRFFDNSLDYVFSSHCLEHLEDWRVAINLWIRKLKIEGILFLYLPHESMKLWNPGGLWVGNIHKWKPTVEVLLPYLSSCGLEIMEFNTYRDEYWCFHIIAKRRGD
ncbi:MAG: methyltransferase domain-containing protein [Desulfamplus sp.]|nr:methyltransferase domain-containing protein [Desulfamplus sp.]